MARYYEIARALCHYVRLHLINPQMSKCIVVSVLLVIAAAGPIARAQSVLMKESALSRPSVVRVIWQEVLVRTR